MPQPQASFAPIIVESGPFKGLQGIGGSDAPVLVGVSPWKSAGMLWAERSGLIEKPMRSTDAMTWGSYLEKPILKAYAEEMGGIRVWTPAGPVFNESRSWQYGHLDGLARGRVIEVKTARHNKGWGEPMTDAIPDHYYAQVMHYLAVTGKPFCDVPVLFAGSDFQVYRVYRSEEYIEGLIEVEAHFMEAVLKGIEPDLDGSEATTRYLKERYPGHEGEVVATAEQAEMVRQLVEANETAEAVEKVRKTWENKVKGAMGDNTRLWTPDVRVDHSIVTRKAKPDWGFIASEYRELIEKSEAELPEAHRTDFAAIEAANQTKASTHRRFALTDVAQEGK
jgi:putative phage-type endonuclease